MDVSAMTWIVALLGLAVIILLGVLQAVAVVRPRDQWTIDNVYGSDPSATDPKAYFAFNQGLAWADAFFWVPLQIAGSAGMLLGERWGFLLALAASVPFVYSAFPLFIWDRDLGYRKNYWVITWGIFPAYGLLEGIYAFARLLS
ncbi:MAG: hypothetical protein HKN24_01360 [Acidimicrobiales bacterium]|nr:hypothetical protein [Acidimicrobiales bacterium]